MDGGPWWAAVHGIAKSRTRLSDFTFTFHFYALGKEMATHSSVLAWRIPGTGEPGGLPSMGSHRVGHDWSDLAAAAAVIVASAYKYRCSSVVEGMRRFKQWTMIKPWEWMIYSYTQQQQCRSNLTNECRVEDPTWKKYTFNNFNYFQHFLRFFLKWIIF